MRSGESQIIVCERGVETFNDSFLSISDGVFEVWATASDTHLDGEGSKSYVIEYSSAV